MNWKRSLSEFLVYVGINFTVFYLSGWKRQGPFFNFHNLTQSALVAIAAGLVIVGLQELRRGGHQEVRRFWGKFLMVWFAIFVIILVEAIKHHETASPDSVVDSLLYLFLVPCIVPFSLALYLNRKQPESTLQPTTNNAS
jgi:Ni,Fe-hydrogenase I cytochrome b subunit